MGIVRGRGPGDPDAQRRRDGDHHRDTGAMPPPFVTAVYLEAVGPDKPVSGVYWTVPVVGSSAVRVPSSGWLEISN